MPYTFVPANAAFDPTDNLPQHLDHKPFYALPYEAFDGPSAGPRGTDVRFISVGLAQYDPYDVSIKTMRHTGSKWTRQAEELPLPRVVDMALYLAKVLFDSGSGAVNLPSGTLTGQTSDLAITQEPRTPGEAAAYDSAVGAYMPDMRDRYNQLFDCLHTLKKMGRF